MRPHLAIFRIRFVNSLQYRMAALAGVSTQFAWGFMEITAFAAFYQVRPEAFPMTLAQTASYIWLQQALLYVFFVMLSDNDIVSTVIDGNIAYEMVRPMDLYSRWFSQIAATRLAGALLRAVPVLTVAFFIPYPFGLMLPPSFAQFAGFIVSGILAMAVTVAFTNFIYVSLFYTMSIQGMRIMMYGLVAFLSGQTVPIPFFPEPLQRVVELLPFAAMQNMPLRIYNGHIAGAEMYQGIALQVFWLIVLVAAGRALIGNAYKRVVVQGG